ncbi:MAG: hypothetical protein QXH42_04910 [Thermoplasmata archaeon]
MSELLEDILNLDILENLCSGSGVEVNISALASMFSKHRNTIKNHLRELFGHEILNPPVYPFLWIYQEYPLMITVRADLPREEKIERFLKEDEHIFAAFYVRDGEYNTFLIEFFENLFTYGEWRKRIVAENLIPPRETRYPGDAMMFSNQHMIKYQPHSPVINIEERISRGETVTLNGLRLSSICFNILKKLTFGEGIRTNENLLAQKLGVHRRTIERRIKEMLEARIIGPPVCRFPKFFVPPDYILVYYLMEVRKSMDKLLNAIKTDPSIPIALLANIGRYNLLLFGCYANVEEHFRWEELYDSRFPGAIGAMKKLILLPKMMANIDQQKVSLGIIRRRKEMLRGRELVGSVTSVKGG